MCACVCVWCVLPVGMGLLQHCPLRLHDHPAGKSAMRHVVCACVRACCVCVGMYVCACFAFLFVCVCVCVFAQIQPRLTAARTGMQCAKSDHNRTATHRIQTIQTNTEVQKLRSRETMRCPKRTWASEAQLVVDCLFPKADILSGILRNIHSGDKCGNCCSKDKQYGSR